MKNFLFLLTVVVGYYFGIYFYCRGFLLTRNALLINSTCPEVQAEKKDACWMGAKFQKAILIVVDALRYDFIAWQSTNSSLPYHNKFLSVEKVLKNRPKNGLLFKFIADPPTTTLQRLKALTTGSLPTFVDAGSNFGGSAIEEDNIIDQLVRKNDRKITFMGDDTWVSLFPSQFAHQFPYPSFDVKDLHTVDNGVIEHLLPELNNTESSHWTLLIAHFLGVDHCGHKYGPNHPEMALKLSQLDEILGQVMSSMDADTVLFVLGDHGMTQTGDHGGDSVDETSAALFVYSPTVLHNEESNVREAIVQVDLVPTLSMLLDLPIPYSNLGAIIRELFPNEATRLQAAKANVWQVVRYTESYLTNYPDTILSERFQPILKVFHILEEDDELTIDKSFEIIRQIGQVFVECWAKFHLGWMTLGILTIIETFLYSLSLLLDRHRSLSGRKILLKIFVFSSCMLVILARNETIPPIVGLILTAQVVVHLHTTVSSMISSTNNISASLNAPTILAILTLILRAISQFSNSFVVYENSISQYLSKTLFFIIYWQNFITKRPVSQNAAGAATMSSASQQIGRSRKKLNWKQLLDLNFNLKALLYLILVLFTLRMGNFFNRCREEQTDCIASSFTLPFASLFDDAFRFLRVLLALLTLTWYSTIPHWFLRKNGHFQEDSAFSLICQFGTGVAALSCLSYWILQWIPDKYFGLTFDLNGFNPAWVVYLFVFFSLLAFLRNPLLTYYRQIDLGRARLGRFSDPVQAYKHMKSNWQQYFTEKAEEKTIFVHGAQSAYSAGFASLLWIFIWMVTLLLGDGISLQVVCFSVVAVVALEFSQDNSSLVVITFLFAELSSHFFYAFGHHATFSSIPWDAAFIGVPGNFGHQFLQGGLVIIHISSSYLLTSFCLPLLVVWSLYTKKLGSFTVRRSTSNDCDNELKLAENEEKFLENVAFCNLTYLSALAIKLIAIVMASAIHRRHLMVWKIFAPKFIFDAILFVFACFCILIQYLFVLRFSKSVVKFIETIPR